MRVGFVDHSYHAQTRTSGFFLDAVFPGAEVDLYWDESWRGGDKVDAAAVAAAEYDLVVAWQSESAALALAASGVPNLVFVPMWDSCRLVPDTFWRKLRSARVVSFCHHLHEHLLRRGLTSAYFQYFPEPGDALPSFADLRGFFWQRRADLTWRDVRRLIGATEFASFHLHLAQDPGADTPIRPSTEERHPRARRSRRP